MSLKDKGEDLLENAADKVEDVQEFWDYADEKKRKKIRIALIVGIIVLMVVVAKCAG